MMVESIQLYLSVHITKRYPPLKDTPPLVFDRENRAEGPRVALAGRKAREC